MGNVRCIYFSILYVGVECGKYIEVFYFLYKILGVRYVLEIRIFWILGR